jgi:hypothetical protein
MQRATSSSTPSTPRTPNSPSTPPSKRQRLSSGISNQRYATSEKDAIQAAIEEEDIKRTLAVEKHAAGIGETRWVLSVRKPVVQDQGLIVKAASFADIDHGSTDESHSDEERPTGRMTFGMVRIKSYVLLTWILT